MPILFLLAAAFLPGGRARHMTFVGGGVNVGVFGGSSLFTSYLQPSQRHCSALQRVLRICYPHQFIKVHNCAENGEYIGRYLLGGKYEADRSRLSGLDLGIIRFGVNDSKRFSPHEFADSLEKFVLLLRDDFPGITTILETGIYLDYPKHYSFDRNLELKPYWHEVRRVAMETNSLLVDFYAVSQSAVLSGDWDLRVRRDLVTHSGFDRGRESDPEWFTDVHPNAAGVRLCVDAEVRIIAARYPEALPGGAVRLDGSDVSTEFLSRLLGFGRERLVASPVGNPEKHLQETLLSQGTL